MRTFAPLLLLIALAACDRRAEILERQYREAEQAGLQDDQCRLAGQLAELHLQRSDEKRYREWALSRDIDCTRAGIERQMSVH